MARPFPSAQLRNPIEFPDGSTHPGTVFLKAVLDHPNIQVGEYSYYSDPDLADDYAMRLAPYLYPGAPENLKIGRFVQIAQRVKFITSSANHPMRGLSTFPFRIFDPTTMGHYTDEIARHGDTTIGSDVWLGFEARIMAGVTVGEGAIVAATATVSRDVPPYAIVAGNPAQVVRMRFDASTIRRLLELGWWDWPIHKIIPAITAIEAGDVAALEAMAP